MSSSSFDATIDLLLRPSLRALKILFLLHLVPLAALPFAMPSGIPMLLLAGALLASWLYLRRHPAFGFGPRALSRLTWHADGRWTVHAGGAAKDAQLLGSSHVHSLLIVLRFREQDGPVRTRALLGDETAPELLQRLRARLAVAHDAS